MTRWIDPPPVDIPTTFIDLNLPPLVAQTLLRRGIDTPEAARAFLYADLLPSTPFPGIEPAVERIQEAIRSKERVCVWGDFDVDGQTSTALLVQTLRGLGTEVVSYIPIRGKESHGVHIETLKPIIDNGAKLILTCDTGITAYEAIDYANSRGVDVVISDHHDPGPALPDAKAIVNPKLLAEDHVLANLAGVGVAYKLAEALFDNGARLSHSRSLTPDSLLDLVALGLIADVALLKGETRSLVQRGLHVLRNTDRIGLRTMAELSGTSLESLTEETVGFTFAPRLNALGRLGDANPAVELLLSHDPARVRVIAAQIEGLNVQRRLLTSQVFEAAQAQLQETPELLSEPVIILSNENWPGGVVGIVANRLVELYRKPAILFNRSEQGILRGSARSVEGLHLTDAIATQKDLLLSFGGHPMAAGLALEAWRLPEFRKGLGRAIEAQLGGIVRQEPTLQIDAWLGLDQVDLQFAESLEALAPFGPGNPTLTFGTRSVSLRSAAAIGKNREHLRLTVEDEQGNLQALLWWGGADSTLPEEGSQFDIAYSMRASSFRGAKQVSVQFEELRIVQAAPPELSRRQVEVVDYRREVERLESLPGEVLVWAEGADRARGKHRFELHPAEELAIYSAPPAAADLRTALDTVRPSRVYLFGVAPDPEKADVFLERLAGLVKYAINQKGGEVRVAELAGVTGQRDGAVRLGLEWLATGGHISVKMGDDAVHLSHGDHESNQYLQRELYLAIKGILEETAAYRAHFRRADPDNLIE